MRQIARITLLVVVLIGGVVEAGWGQEDAKQHWEELNAQVVAAYQQGKYTEGIGLAEQARTYAVEYLGTEHPDTLTSINNLAGLYESQGRYSEAEPLYKECLQLREQVLGREHPDTLSSINELAVLYINQGRYSDAEPLFKYALQLREKVLGKSTWIRWGLIATWQHFIMSRAIIARRSRFLSRCVDSVLNYSNRHCRRECQKRVRRIRLEYIL
ncbi:MAG: tetratricopeptide repeat protein [Candidatus Electrothrix sp. MAN1_4]|nr:tetratricopeptide repeat protein [Candidatus Electrothrix sp. MAN1_4]